MQNFSLSTYKKKNTFTFQHQKKPSHLPSFQTRKPHPTYKGIIVPRALRVLPGRTRSQNRINLIETEYALTLHYSRMYSLNAIPTKQQTRLDRNGITGKRKQQTLERQWQWVFEDPSPPHPFPKRKRRRH